MDDRNSEDVSQCKELTADSMGIDYIVQIDDEDMQKVLEDLKKNQKERNTREIIARLVNEFEHQFFTQYLLSSGIGRSMFIAQLEKERNETLLELNRGRQEGDPIVELRLSRRDHQDLLATKQYHIELFAHYKRYFSDGDDNDDQKWRIVFDLRKIVTMGSDENYISFGEINEDEKQAYIRECRLLHHDSVLVQSLLDALDRQVATVKTPNI